MINQSGISPRSETRTMIDIILVSISTLIGGAVAMLVIWLWLDYQTDPGRSLLAIASANLAGLIPPSFRVYLENQAVLMGLPLVNSTPAYWYMARAGGIVAYLLLWLSTVWGLTLSTKITDGLIPAPIAYGLHEFLSLGAVVFAILHGAVLLGDEYFQFNLIHLIVPYTAPYQPFWTGLGTITLYLTVILTASFYLRKQIGQKTWRALHYLTFAGYMLALLHGLMAGTDTALPVIKLMYLGTGFTVLFLTYYRLFTLKKKVPGTNS
jgi:predicted ferric reductase